MSDREAPFVFIGGCGRSGTSLLQKTLLAHTRIGGGPELDHTKAIFELFAVMSKPFFLKRQSFFYSGEELAGAFRGFYRSLFHRLATSEPEPLWIAEKTPTNIDVAATLLEVMPDARFVHVVRDGRDVLASHLDVRRRYRESGEPVPEGLGVRDVCRLWNRSNQAYFDLADNQAFKGRCFLVRFEDLLNRPEKELRRLCDFLGIGFEEAMLHPEALDPETTGYIVDNLWNTATMSRSPFDSGKIGRWKSALGGWTRMEANVRMAAKLKRFDYPVGAASLRIAGGLRAFRG